MSIFFCTTCQQNKDSDFTEMHQFMKEPENEGREMYEQCGECYNG